MGKGRKSYKHWGDIADNAKIDFYYRVMVKVKETVKGFPESTFQGIVNELRYRKAFPVLSDEMYNHGYGMTQNVGYCPRCRRRLKSGTTYKQYSKDGIGPRHEFCPRCGQHIDWSEFEITDLHSLEAMRARSQARREAREREREREQAQSDAGIPEETDVAGLEIDDD